MTPWVALKDTMHIFFTAPNSRFTALAFKGSDGPNVQALVLNHGLRMDPNTGAVSCLLVPSFKSTFGFIDMSLRA